MHMGRIVLALDDLFAQHLEIILIDDGSVDDSIKVLKSLIHPRVHVFSKKNGGPSSARNYGISKAKGDYLLFIDSDDEVAPDFIYKLLTCMEDSEIALASTGYLYHRLSDDSKTQVSTRAFPQKKNESLKSYVLRALLSGRMYAVNNKIFRSSIINRSRLHFDETINFAEDTKFVLDYLTAAEGKIMFIPEPLYIYNYGTKTSVSSSLDSKWDNWKKSYQNLKKWVGDHPSLEERYLLHLVYVRWRIACIHSLLRTKRPNHA